MQELCKSKWSWRSSPSNVELSLTILSPVFVIISGQPCREPSTYEEAMQSTHRIQWEKAIKAEISCLARNNTWTKTDMPDHRNAITNKWVLEIKTHEKGHIIIYMSVL